MPGVTDRSGSPSTGATGTSSFVRVDVPLSPTNMLTFEGIVAPAHATLVGLSPLTELAAAPDILNRDLFGGRRRSHRHRRQHAADAARRHRPAQDRGRSRAARGNAILEPDGWHQNFFAEVSDTGVRRAASATLDRSGLTAAGVHTFSFSFDVRERSMSGAIETHPIQIQDDARPDDAVHRDLAGAVAHARATRRRASAFAISWAPDAAAPARPQPSRGFPDARAGGVLAAICGKLRARRQRAGRPSRAASAGSSDACRLARWRSTSSASRIDLSFVSGVFVRRAYSPSLGQLKLPQADMVSIEVEQQDPADARVAGGVQAS